MGDVYRKIRPTKPYELDSLTGTLKNGGITVKDKSKLILKINIGAAIICIALGVLLHFLFELADKNYFVALISAVNESTWEHLKLLFIPYTLIMIIEYFIYGKNMLAFFLPKLCGVIVGIISIITFFYTYTGIFGKSIDAINIIIYVLSVVIAYGVANILSNLPKRKENVSGFTESLAIIGFAVITTAFFIFTFYPPHIPLFRDPTTMGFGIA